MSRTNDLDVKSPAKFFFQWDGDKGGFKYYDKELENGTEKKGGNVAVALPFRFMVLDVLSTIKGFNDSEKLGYYSNEVRNLKTEEFTVRTKKGIEQKGLYENIIEKINGGKFVSSVYIAYKHEDKMIIANIQIMGAALGSWFDFKKSQNIMKCAVVVDGMIDGKKGKVEFKIPVFKAIPTTPQSEEVAGRLDKELQEYLTVYFNRSKAESVQESTHEAVETKEEIVKPDATAPENKPWDPNDGDDLPFSFILPWAAIGGVLAMLCKVGAMATSLC